MWPGKYCGQRIRIRDTMSVPVGRQDMVARGSGKMEYGILVGSR